MLSVATVGNPPEDYPKLTEWVAEVAALTKPEAIHWVDGSAAEWDQLTSELVDAGTFVRLNDEK